MPEQIPDEVSGGTLADPRLVTPDVLRRWPLPEPTGSKYGRGQAVVVGGSCSTPGAVLLAGVSALRMGAGKLHLGVAEGVAPHLAVAVPESGVTALAQSASGSVTGTGAGAASGPASDHRGSRWVWQSRWRASLTPRSRCGAI